MGVKQDHIVRELEIARKVFGNVNLISEGAALVAYIDEVQEKCDINLEYLALVVRNFPFFMEGERHMAMRQRVLKHMGVNAKLKPWAPYIDDRLASALRELETKKEADLLADFISPFLQETTCTVLGILTEDPHKFEQCASLAEQLLNPLLPLRVLKKMEVSFAGFFEEILSREPSSREDGNVPLLSELLKAPIPEYSRADISAFVLVVYAGTIALRYTLGNIILRILSGPESIKKKAADKEWVQANLDHLIRESVAVKKVSRTSKVRQEVGGLSLHKGETVLIDMQAIHHGTDSGCPLHKESKWDEETLKQNAHLAFGKGSHYCLGANYSKFILEKVLPAFFKKYPDIRLVDPTPDVMNHTQMIGVKTLKCYLGNS